jgi:tRNA(Phe) wybutosine-synthesizing methylase Tyw3
MLDQPLTNPSAKNTGKKGIPYDELDANIVRLVQALNHYPGVMTVGSCGGHDMITVPFQNQSDTEIG